MTRSMTRSTLLAAAFVAQATLPVRAQDEAAATEGDACVQAPEPVVALDYGSRYTADSADRSDFDEESNADVEAQLAPVDEFVRDLAVSANLAQKGGAEGARAADCVIEAVHVWAKADALSRLESPNAQLSAPSRLGGIALAYLQAKQHADSPDASRQEVIEAWLDRQIRATMDFFDEDAPRRASRNNLRAWAGLAAAAVGRATGDQEAIDWAADTVELVACQADEDGALPLEMDRGPRALHYHLHAVAPLVVSAAILSEEGRDLWEICDGAIHRIVAFVPAAFDDPDLVNDKAGETQTYFDGDDELRGFEIAWAEAYLARFNDPALASLVDDFRPLANSKLGGDQALLW